MIKISVFIPTFNPNLSRLTQTLIGLKSQTFPIADWELIIIDNNSTISFADDLDLSWHPNSRIIREPKAGLTFARLKGFKESNADIIIMVDDDNILEKKYLTETYKIFEENHQLCAIGGKSVPLFEHTPPDWLNRFYGNLALRDLGEDIILEKWSQKYPDSAPIGAGMALRKLALTAYINKIESGNGTITDRKGTNLSSGGDNDIILEILKSGWQIAYYPSLSLQHIIPKERTEVKYLGKLNKDSTKSWINLLNSHQVNPWHKIPKWSIPFRKLKAWFVYQPWKNEVNYINYSGVCGMYEALGEI